MADSGGRRRSRRRAQGSATTSACVLLSSLLVLSSLRGFSIAQPVLGDVELYVSSLIWWMEERGNEGERTSAKRRAFSLRR